MSCRKYEAGTLPGPDTLRVHFTATGRIRKASGGSGSAGLGLSPSKDGRVHLYAQGPMGWWHDFQTISPETSFDEAVRLTYLPKFYGWDK